MGGMGADGWDVPQQVIHIVKENSYWWIPIAVALIGAIGGAIKIILRKKKNGQQ